MKKIVLTVLIATLSIFIFSSKINTSVQELREAFLEKEKSNQWSRDEFQEISLYLLYPTLDETINKYYSKYLTISPTVYHYYPYTEILHVEKLFSGEYQLKLRIRSVVGPHISVGLDEVTLTIGAGSVKVSKFEHIESFELPQRYEQYIKEGYENPIP